MRGMLVFDHLNDVVYVKCCHQFVQHVAKLAESQGLAAPEHSNTLFGRGRRAIDPNILIQLFSPLVTSQRFMKEQFGNPYASVQCEDGTNIVFHEYMGYLFLRVGTEDMPYLKRVVGVCISLVSYICGPDVGLLKTSQKHAEELDSLLNTWAALQSCDQTFLIEALEQMTMTPQKSTALIKALQQISSKVQIQNEHVHALLFSDTKLLSWYSSKGAFQMTSEDILVLMILCQKTWPGHNLRELQKKRLNYVKLGEAPPAKGVSSSSETESEESDWTSTGFSSSTENLFDEFEYLAELGEELEDENPKNVNTDEMKSFAILLRSGVQFVPHRVHLGFVQDGIFLVLLLEPPTSQLITSLCTSIQMGIDFHAARRDISRDKHYVELIENIVKKDFDLLKKQKNMPLRNDLSSRWDTFKIGFQTYLKTKSPISVQISPVVDTLIVALRSYLNEQQILYENPKVLNTLTTVWNKIKSNSEPAWSCLKISSTRELSLGARQALIMSKYLEDFPGLVHFIYIDRSKHSIIFPPVDFNSDDAVKLTKRKIWSMVKFAREHMQQGHFSLMWKDSAFNFAYFLWFEDMAGMSIRPKCQASLPWDGYPPPPLPGIMCGDFYKRVVSECFPGTTTPKVRCLELFCIHLGLVTSSLVLQHCKRLATTIYDATGSANPVDLL